MEAVQSAMEQRLAQLESALSELRFPDALRGFLARGLRDPYIKSAHPLLVDILRTDDRSLAQFVAGQLFVPTDRVVAALHDPEGRGPKERSDYIIAKLTGLHSRTVAKLR